MKTSHIDGVSPERLAELRKSMKPGMSSFNSLWEKVRSGKATEKERIEYDKLTKRARELDPNVLVD